VIPACAEFQNILQADLTVLSPPFLRVHRKLSIHVVAVVCRDIMLKFFRFSEGLGDSQRISEPHSAP
jgi:hypothetical protein